MASITFDRVLAAALWRVLAYSTSVMLEHGTPSQPPFFTLLQPLLFSNRALHPLPDPCAALVHLEHRAPIPYPTAYQSSDLCACISTRPADHDSGSLRFSRVIGIQYSCCMRAAAAAAPFPDRLRLVTHRHHHRQGRALFHISANASFACLPRPPRHIRTAP